MTQGKQEMLSTAEVASRLNVHETTVQRWVRLGYFPGARKKGPARNSPYVIPNAAVEAFVEQQERQATAATPGE